VDTENKTMDHGGDVSKEGPQLKEGKGSDLVVNWGEKTVWSFKGEFQGGTLRKVRERCTSKSEYRIQELTGVITVGGKQVFLERGGHMGGEKGL